MAQNALASALIEDYEALGFGERISENELRSLDGETVVALESGDSNELLVFVNGDLVETLAYSRPDFSSTLLKQVAGALNV